MDRWGDFVRSLWGRVRCGVSISIVSSPAYAQYIYIYISMQFRMDVCTGIWRLDRMAGEIHTLGIGVGAFFLFLIQTGKEGPVG